MWDSYRAIQDRGSNSDGNWGANITAVKTQNEKKIITFKSIKCS